MRKKHVIDGFIAIILALIVIDALPRPTSAQTWLKDAIDPFLDVTGLWQESWRLFGPVVDKTNVRLSARITYADGTRFTWRSPDWTTMSPLERFLNFREMEYVDSIRLDTNKGAWPSLADYLARTVLHPRSPELAVTEVALTRHWATVPPPVPRGRLALRPTPEDSGSYLFYEKSYRR